MGNTSEIRSTITLTEVEQQFQSWRLAKRPGEKIPEVLWEMVAKLLTSNEYKYSFIIRALGISGSQLYKKFPKNLPIKYTKPKQHQPFVQAKLDIFNHGVQQPCAGTHRNRMNVIFSTVDQEQLTVLIKALMA